jgi:hypothetical protein
MRADEGMKGKREDGGSLTERLMVAKGVSRTSTGSL